MHAAGGDPHRDPELDDPAVLALARDLDTTERREALIEALPALLRADPDRAWRAYAAALLADALAED